MKVDLCEVKACGCLIDEHTVYANGNRIKTSVYKYKGKIYTVFTVNSLVYNFMELNYK